MVHTAHNNVDDEDDEETNTEKKCKIIYMIRDEYLCASGVFYDLVLRFARARQSNSLVNNIHKEKNVSAADCWLYVRTAHTKVYSGSRVSC